MLNRTVRVLGFDESVNTCECCGKSPIKGTFAVELASGQVMYYGSTCVTRHTGKPAKVILQDARAALAVRCQSARQEVRDHPTYAAYEARMRQAHTAGLIGSAFREFCRREWEAQAAAQAEIAKRHGVMPHEIAP